MKNEPIKKLKSAFLMLAAASFVLACTACSGNTNNTTESDSKATANSTITATTEIVEFWETLDVVFNVTHKKTIDIDRYIKPLEYKGIDITHNGKTREDVYADVIKMGETQYKERYDGKVESGDAVVLDFSAYKDDADKPFLQDVDYEWNIGNGEFFDMLGLDLAGKAVGSDVSETLKFPDDYINESYRGKNARFDIKIKYVKDFTNPTVDDAFVEEYTLGKFKTIESYVDHLYEKTLIDDIKEEYFQKIYDFVISRGVAYDSEIVDLLKADTKKSDKELASQLNTTPAKYYGLSEEAYETRVDSNAKEYFIKTVLIYAIAYEESISYTQSEEVQAYASEQSKALWITPEEYIERFGEEYIKESLFWDKVLSYLAASANIVDKK